MRIGVFDMNETLQSGYEIGDQHTYVIEAVGHGMVKIGKTKDITSRLATLQTSCPFPLRLVEWLLGDWESSLHSLLAEHRINGEWFRYVPEVDRLIGLLDKVPRWV